jgi:hypothetical protein
MKRWQMIGQVAWRVVVAACLVLIVVKMYGSDGVRVESWEMESTLRDMKGLLTFIDDRVEQLETVAKDRVNR